MRGCWTLEAEPILRSQPASLSLSIFFIFLSLNSAGAICAILLAY